MQQAPRTLNLACPKKKTFISLHKPCLTNIVPTLQESEMHRFLTEASPLLEVHVSKKTGISVPSLPVGDIYIPSVLRHFSTHHDCSKITEIDLEMTSASFLSTAGCIPSGAVDIHMPSLPKYSLILFYQG